MKTTLFEAPVLFVARAAALVAMSTLPATALAASLTHSTSFTAAGGDVRSGDGDTSFTPLVSGLPPLFDHTLGTLERVDITLQGWRSISFTCSNGSGWGNCSARAAGTWVLDGINLVVPSALTMATLDVVADGFTGLTPPPGTTQSAVSFVERSMAVSFSDPTQLRLHFSDETGGASSVAFRLMFGVGDGGGFGYGGTAGITSLVWDGDAALSMTYHYTAAVPEPATWAGMAAGLGLLGWLRRRREPAPR